MPKKTGTDNPYGDDSGTNTFGSISATWPALRMRREAACTWPNGASYDGL
ncbi:hypothetical protein [Streptomyces canus]|nr:hypothetical protein [Streptomyces canus]WSD92507.1 hypothetical protein OG925_48230 [Streptomyces canus]